MSTAEQTIEIDGSFGLETNVSQHAGDLVPTFPAGSPGSTKARTFRVFKNLVTDVANRIVKRDGKGATLGSVAGTEIQSLHEYVYVDPTTGAESYHVLGAIDGGSYIYRWNGATTWTGQTLPITPTAGGRWFFCNADNRVFAMNGKDALLVGIQTAPNTITWRTAGVDAPSFAPTYSLTTTNPPYATGTISAVQGSPTITGTVPAIWVTGGSWNNLYIDIDGTRYRISTVAVAGNGTTIAPVLTLTEGFKENTASGLTYSIYLGVGDWADIAPQYCFSYYNPTTGHCSLPSPTLQVTEQNQVGRTLTITIPGSAENTTANTNGYTQIQLFRTPKSAGILVAINEKLANNGTGAAITYVETATKFLDTYLTDLEVPLLTRKPPSGLACMAFHQGRGWAIHAPSGTLRFTPISVEVDLGKAIESWPALYKRDMPAAPRGLAVVGGESSADSLVIQTSRGDYSMDGFDSTTFSPYKLKTRRSGGYLGAATDVDGDLVQFYADKRFFVMQEDIAKKIQDKLDAVKDSLISKVRVHWHSAKSRNYLFLSLPSTSGSTANDYTYVFNLDKQGDIYEWPFGVSAFATVHDSSSLALQLFAGDPAGAVYKLLEGGAQDAGSDFAPTLRTALLRFPETRTEIKYIKLFVSDPQLTGATTQERATLWTGVLYLNEQTNSGATDGSAVAMTFRQQSYRKQSAQGNELIWTPTQSLRTKSKVFQLDLTFPSINSLPWIEKIIVGFDAEQSINQAVGKQA